MVVASALVTHTLRVQKPEPTAQRYPERCYAPGARHAQQRYGANQTQTPKPLATTAFGHEVESNSPLKPLLQRAANDKKIRVRGAFMRVFRAASFTSAAFKSQSIGGQILSHISDGRTTALTEHHRLTVT